MLCLRSYSITHAAFCWSEHIPGPAQVQGREDRAHMSMEGGTEGFITIFNPQGLPWWLRRQSVCLQCGRPGFHPWVRKLPWRKKRQPTPVLLPGKSHRQRSLVGCSPRGRKESDTTERLCFPFLCFQRRGPWIFVSSASTGFSSLPWPLLWPVMLFCFFTNGGLNIFLMVFPFAFYAHLCLSCL